MFTKRFELFKIFGFSVKVDLSWLVIAVLLTWSLAVAGFPQLIQQLYGAETAMRIATGTYWIMGAAGMLGLFAAVILHELSHSLAARQFNMQMRGITLFIFGGVAEMDEEPPTAKAEFWMAIAGPIASILIGAACYGVFVAGRQLAWPVEVQAVLLWLAIINGVLVAFNLIPAFPLDGGRVLRSVLWYFKGNLKWATKITSALGAGFGLFLILYGIFRLIFAWPEGVIGAMWMVLIGMFLRAAAAGSYQQLMVRRALEGENVERFMTRDVTKVPPNATVQQLVDDYVYKYHYKMFPIAGNGKLEGCVTTRMLRDVPREDWPRRTVQELAQACSAENTISPAADATQALSKMRRNNISRLMVVEGDELRGVITLKDMMRFISSKVELEEV